MDQLITPIQYFGASGGAEVYIKRDDLLPFSFGGNKVRILQEVFAERKEKGWDALISYGSPSSNLNRVAAHMAAKENLPLTVIVKKEKEGKPETARKPNRLSFNEQMVKQSGARFRYTEPDRVRETVEQALKELEDAGKKPFYIYGDSTGKGSEELLSRAYRKAFAEIIAQEKERGTEFDTIVLPVGTGATLAGLAAACDQEHRIFGISVARSREKVLEKLKADLYAIGFSAGDRIAAGQGSAGAESADANSARTEQACTDTACADTACAGDAGREAAGREMTNGSEPGGRTSAESSEETESVEKWVENQLSRVEVTDAYLQGGYGCFEEKEAELIRNIFRKKGLPLDPVYTGKAFYGMTEEIRKGSLRGNVLFLHTGGLPLFFDQLLNLLAR